MIPLPRKRPSPILAHKQNLTFRSSLHSCMEMPNPTSTVLDSLDTDTSSVCWTFKQLTAYLGTWDANKRAYILRQNCAQKHGENPEGEWTLGTGFRFVQRCLVTPELCWWWWWWSVAKSCLTLLWPPWTIADQAPLSVGFSRQEYWSGFAIFSPGDLLDPGIKPMSSALAGRFFFTAELPADLWREVSLRFLLSGS